MFHDAEESAGEQKIPQRTGNKKRALKIKMGNGAQMTLKQQGGRRFVSKNKH